MSKSMVLPAGRYYLGDPCYVFNNHNSWMLLLEASNYLEEFIELNMRQGLRGEGWVAASNTQWGDGEYAATFHGARLGVDAGLIGVVHESIVKHHATATLVSGLRSTNPLSSNRRIRTGRSHSRPHRNLHRRRPRRGRRGLRRLRVRIRRRLIAPRSQQNPPCAGFLFIAVPCSIVPISGTV